MTSRLVCLHRFRGCVAAHDCEQANLRCPLFMQRLGSAIGRIRASPRRTPVPLLRGGPRTLAGHSRLPFDETLHTLAAAMRYAECPTMEDLMLAKSRARSMRW